MTPFVESLDLASLHLTSGEGRRMDVTLPIEPFDLGQETYPVTPSPVEARLDISRTTGSGYALRLRFTATLEGPCMRCLDTAAPAFEVEAREISQPGEGEELDSPYVVQGVLDIAGWARDALALTLPSAILCRRDCAGLCAKCGANLNTAGPEHHHEAEPDPRWAKLSELKFGE